MRRFLWLALLTAGTFAAALSTAVYADDEAAGSSYMMEDMNTALGSMTNRLADVEKKQGAQIEIHGFAESDYITDSETTGMNEYISNKALAKQGTLAGQSEQTQFSLRNSRVDFLAKDTVGGWLTKGYVEGDFLGASNTAESNLYVAPTFRIRHAYLEALKDGWDIMAGQYWTLFGWNMDYVIASVQPQPVMGTFYERTPRLGVMKTLGDDFQVQIAVDAERPEESLSAYPNFNGGIRFLLSDWKGAFSYATGATKIVPLSLGISGTIRNYADGATAANNWTNTNYEGSGVAVDAMIPVLPATDNDDCSLVIAGECTMSKGAGDELNGWSGGATPVTAAGNEVIADSGIAGFKTVGGTFGLIDAQSWNAQLQFHFPKSWGTYVTGAYGEVYSDNIGTFTGASYNDDNNFIANIMQDVTNEVRVAIEYDFAQTHYLAPYNTGKGLDNIAYDNRVLMSSWYRF